MNPGVKTDVIVFLVIVCGILAWKQLKTYDWVTYEICELNYKNCKPFAMFDDFDSCQDHLEISNSGCNRVSDPTKIICDKTVKSTISSSRCVK